MTGDFVTRSEVFQIMICIIILLQFHYVQSNLPEAVASSEHLISIMAAGDSIGYNIENENLSNLSSSIIHNSTDIFIFNLEGVLADNASLSN
jgi:hypothetical protein